MINLSQDIPEFFNLIFNNKTESTESFKGVLHPWALFLRICCIFSKNKATSDKVSYGFGQKCSKELKNHSFTSVETTVMKLQWKMWINIFHILSHKSINTWVSEIPVQ